MTDDTQGLTNLNDMAAKLQGSMAGSGAQAHDMGSLFGSMNMTTLMISLFAGLVGSAYFMYGKKTCNMKTVLCGVALCVVPYFITNTILLVVACIAMAAFPFV